jgi:hypothetical protein
MINMTSGGTGTEPALTWGERIEMQGLSTLERARDDQRQRKGPLGELKFKQEEAIASATGMKFEAGPVTRGEEGGHEERPRQRDPPGADPQRGR